jgi:hypothetical protein
LTGRRRPACGNVHNHRFNTRQLLPGRKETADLLAQHLACLDQAPR